jgi:hypothetical protein
MFWETAFDVVSSGFSIWEVVQNPKDPWAWAGLVGDAIDLLPIVTGVGETTRAIKAANKIVDTADNAVDAIKGGSKVVDDVLPIGGKITGYTKHGLNQAIGRDGGIGVATKAILDTVKNPLKIVEQEGKYGKTLKYVGKNAVVILNEVGEIVTTYAKGSAGLRGVR